MSPARMKNCPSCGEEIWVASVKCRYCGVDLDYDHEPGDIKSPAMVDRMLTPVGRPVSAIVSGYCAVFAGYCVVFGVFPMCGLAFSIAALICGIVALKAIQQRPNLSGIGRAWFGVILGLFLTLVSAARGFPELFGGSG